MLRGQMWPRATEGLLETLRVLGMMVEVVKNGEEREGVQRSMSQRAWGGSVPCPTSSSHAPGVGLCRVPHRPISWGGSVPCPTSSHAPGVGLCRVPHHPISWGGSVLSPTSSHAPGVGLCCGMMGRSPHGVGLCCVPGHSTCVERVCATSQVIMGWLWAGGMPCSWGRTVLCPRSSWPCPPCRGRLNS